MVSGALIGDSHGLVCGILTLSPFASSSYVIEEMLDKKEMMLMGETRKKKSGWVGGVSYLQL